MIFNIIDLLTSLMECCGSVFTYIYRDFFSKMSDFIDCTKNFIFGYMHSEDVMKWVLLQYFHCIVIKYIRT